MTRKRFPVPKCLLVVVALAAAACGGEQFPSAATRPTTPPSTIVDAAKSPRARLLAAVQRVHETSTARIALAMSVSADGQTTKLTGSGEIDLAAARAMDMKLEEPDTGDGPVSVEMRIVNGTVYFDQGDGEGWTSMGYASAVQTLSPDPTSPLDYLQGIADDVHVVGTDVVRGAYSTKYAASIDLGRALTLSRTPAQRAALKVAVGLFGDLKIPVVVWIDELGQLRKIQVSIDLSAAAKKLGFPTGAGAKIDESLELYDYGVHVDIQVPAGARNALAAAQDRGAQSDLRNALTAEKTVYTDTQMYETNPVTMREIESSLDWGGKLTVVVGPAGGLDHQTVCLSERSKSGMTFALLDVAMGSAVGTYYGSTGCPATVDDTSLSGFTTTGWK